MKQVFGTIILLAGIIIFGDAISFIATENSDFYSTPLFILSGAIVFFGLFVLFRSLKASKDAS